MGFELTPVLNEGKYEIKNFDEQLKNLNEFIQTLPLNLVIENEDDYQFVKGKRTTVNKYEKVIKDARKQINTIVLGTLNDQLKQCEKLLKEKSDLLKQSIDEYKPKEVAPKEFATFEVKMSDYEKVKKLLLENGIEFQERI